MEVPRHFCWFRWMLFIGLIYPSICFADFQFEHHRHPARHLPFWNSLGFTQLPIEQRIKEIPSLLLDYLNKDNQRQGFPNKPSSVILDKSFKKDLEDALKELPLRIKTATDRTLGGIFIVHNLGGSAYTDTILDEEFRPVGAFIILDQEVLNKRANEWLTWKENTAFNPVPGYELRAEIEPSFSNTRKNAIQFIVLHELGHVIASTGGVHPAWNKPPSKDDSPSNYPFSMLSWTIGENDQYKALNESAFPLRSKITYYRNSESRLPLSEAKAIYSQLEKSNFPTLYGATAPYDDFSESVATYVHTILLKRPYRITLAKDGKVLFSFESCWSHPRCQTKRKALETILLK